MTVVTGGYGLPEEGAIVAGGMGISEQVEGAIVAHLSGSGAITATLTAADNNEPLPDLFSGGLRRQPEPKRRVKKYANAQLRGSAYVFAELTGVDNLAPVIMETNTILLLELV